MKPSSSSSAWNRLVAAARTVPDEREIVLPPGFATRVVARALAAPRRTVSLFEVFSWRALGVAGLLALVCVLANMSAFTSGGSSTTTTYDDVMSGDDAVARLLDLS